ncbi:hypothetical protein PILCRDRAFT_830517, partial [Piloderma croceum F 1598]
MRPMLSALRSIFDLAGQTPSPVRSLRPAIPLPPPPFLPHPIGPHNDPCNPLQHETNAERVMLDFRFGRPNPLSRAISSSCHPTTTTTLS